jgi:exopolysaccharide biosynthesis polyprenyl glycosylphosphotransferase
MSPGVGFCVCERAAICGKTARLGNAREIGLVLPWGRDRALSEVLHRLRASPLPVRLYPDHKVRDILRRERGRGRDPHFSVLVQRAPLTGYERAVKRTFDVATAASLLLVLAPLLAATAFAIKLDSPGPVIFRQRRGGFDNREFMIFKFRTTTVLEDSGVIAQGRREDPRVTQVGRVLRRLSVDELPQLLNVLRGDMSLVGPRPHAVAHAEVYQGQIANYALRNHVKPGLTGAAQVAGLRGETREAQDMARRVERDVWYINNWSLALDLRLLAQTTVTPLRAEAY